MTRCGKKAIGNPANSLLCFCSTCLLLLPRDGRLLMGSASATAYGDLWRERGEREEEGRAPVSGMRSRGHRLLTGRCPAFQVLTTVTAALLLAAVSGCSSLLV
uniref:Uncharacterized protein n=1 Tax=Oryza brachyantha TaxID=4533 RepID=J3MEC0_ORYBR